MFLSHLWISTTCTVIITIINIRRKCRRVVLHLSIVAAIVHIGFNTVLKGGSSAAVTSTNVWLLLMKITSLRLESVYVHCGQLYSTVWYGGELMQCGYRWSTGICISSAPSFAYNGCFSPDDISWFLWKQNTLMKWIIISETPKLQDPKMDWPFGSLKVSGSVW